MSSVIIAGDTSGTITLNAPAVSGTTTLTLPTTSATLLTDSSGVLNIGSGQVYKNASGNVGIGVTPSAWGTGFSQKALQISTAGSLMGLNAGTGNQQINVVTNAYFDGADWKYITSDAALLYSQNTGGIHQWLNAASGTAGNTVAFSERMRIDSSGVLLLAGISAIAGYQFTMYHTDTGGMAYKYNGTSQQNSCSFQNGNGQVGRIYTSGSATTYSTSSDYRLKENIVPMTGALDKVAQLNPVTFTWKVDGTDGQGFIAHELQTVVPDCVGGTKDAVDAEGNPVYQDIDTSFLVATLTAAIQELKAELDAVKTELATLKGAA